MSASLFLTPMAWAAPAGAAAPVGTGCLAQVAGQPCVVDGSSGQPTTLTVPAGLTRATVVLVGGQGANGDFGAVGGAGGMVVAEVQLTPGHQLAVFVGSGGSSTVAGSGWKAGGAGARPVGTAASGGGGGATAVVDASTGTVLAVAGGGGGAGGSYNPVSRGGNGGTAGTPGTSGSLGKTAPPSPSGKHSEKSGIPGDGGCAANQTLSFGSSAPCSTASPADGGSGGAGRSPRNEPLAAAGGGGGAGWAGGNGGDEAVLDPFPAGGGGGGAGSSYVAPGGQLLSSAAAATYQGYVRFSPASSVTTVSCTPGSATSTYRVPAGVTSVFAIVAGGGGNTANGPAPAPGGRGAVASGTVTVRPGETLTMIAGCQGLTGPMPGATGGRGGQGYDNGIVHTGYDGGAAGSPGYLIGPGNAHLVAGGGGGGGGQGWDSLYNQAPSQAGAGGNAGLGWGPQGAGDGSPSCSASAGSNEQSCAYPTQGGRGAASTNSSGSGDQGSRGGRGLDASGGGGGGGAGIRGGTGGDGGSAGTPIEIPFFLHDHSGSGGGGGAGSSGYDNRVTNPLIGTNTAPQGFVTIVAPPSSGNGPNNVGIAVPGSQPLTGGFDGRGNVFDVNAMVKAKAGPGATLPTVTTASFGYTPAVPNGTLNAPDNWTPAGQTIRLRPGGVTASGIGVLGAASNGPSTLQAQVIAANGARFPVTISLPDWTAPPSSRANLRTVVTVPRADTGTTSLYALTIPLPAVGSFVALYLPPQAGSATSSKVHIFDVAAAN